MKTWRDGAAYTNFTDLKETQNLAGRSIVDLHSFGFDSRTDGVLLVNHGKDEANYALSKVNDDGTWTEPVVVSPDDAVDWRTRTIDGVQRTLW